MTKVDFYTGSRDKLRTACQLSYKAMQNEVPVVLHLPDHAMLEKMDRLLWQYPPTAFIPHCRCDHENAPQAAVLLAHQEQDFPHDELLISLHIDCLPFFSRFQRVIEIVGLDQDEVRLGRERYGFYRDRGYELNHIDLSKIGK